MWVFLCESAGEFSYEVSIHPPEFDFFRNLTEKNKKQSQ